MDEVLEISSKSPFHERLEKKTEHKLFNLMEAT